jgi:hypothetical protein
MSIYTFSQESFDSQNQQLSNAFNLSYVHIELTDEERTVCTISHWGGGGLPKGYKHSEETKALLSQVGKGRKIPNRKSSGRTSADFTDEWKSNISKAKLGVPSNQKWDEAQRKFASEKAKKENFGKVCAGRIWINDGVKSIRINPEQFENYPGFIRGRLTSRSVGLTELSS